MEVGNQTKQDESVQAPSPFVQTISRDISLASGTQVVGGVGFRPSMVIFFVNQPGTSKASWGLDDGSNPQAIYDTNATGADEYEAAGTYAIRVIQGGGNSYFGNVSTFDADGFTIAWTKSASPSGSIQVKFVAFK